MRTLINLLPATPEQQRLYRARVHTRRWQEKNLEKRRAYWAKYSAENREQLRDKGRAYDRQRYGPERTSDARWKYHLRKEYGISVEEYDAMRGSQDGCAACGEPFVDERRVYVDHCHITGAVRALLCPRCNTYMGVVDNDTLLEKLLVYRDAHRRGAP